MRKVFLVAGARPNFMKIAPIFREAKLQKNIDCKVVHTGQHYDFEMSEAFFRDLELPDPDFFLDAGSGSHAVQTAKIMVSFEKLCQEEMPDFVIVVGDVNSTLACSIVAKKLLIPVAHVEAGLRSYDLSMPEEINRMVTDSISDIFFVTEESGSKNLLREGKDLTDIHLVGNVMIDNLFFQLEKIQENDIKSYDKLGFCKGSKYLFLTLHRPSNVDCRDTFLEIVSALNSIAEDVPIFFPVHPRTGKMIDMYHIEFSENIKKLPPLSFREALYIWKDAAIVLTDSGGLQEETTALGVPCITIRENTERPVTIEHGSNFLVGANKNKILSTYEKIINSEGDLEFSIPPMWDGQAAKRIWQIINKV